jgi:hypothetical protein
MARDEMGLASLVAIPGPTPSNGAQNRFSPIKKVRAPYKKNRYMGNFVYMRSIFLSLFHRTKTRREESETVVLPLLAGNMHMGHRQVDRHVSET